MVNYVQTVPSSPHLCAVMQDKGSGQLRDAAGPTTEEFVNDVMAPTMAAAEKMLLHGKGKFKRSHFKHGEKIMYSFDGAAIHSSAVRKQADGTSLLEAVDGYTNSQKVPLPL